MSLDRGFSDTSSADLEKRPKRPPFFSFLALPLFFESLNVVGEDTDERMSSKSEVLRFDFFLDFLDSSNPPGTGADAAIEFVSSDGESDSSRRMLASMLLGAFLDPIGDPKSSTSSSGNGIVIASSSKLSFSTFDMVLGTSEASKYSSRLISFTDVKSVSKGSDTGSFRLDLFAFAFLGFEIPLASSTALIGLIAIKSFSSKFSTCALFGDRVMISTSSNFSVL